MICSMSYSMDQKLSPRSDSLGLALQIFHLFFLFFIIILFLYTLFCVGAMCYRACETHLFLKAQTVITRRFFLSSDIIDQPYPILAKHMATRQFSSIKHCFLKPIPWKLFYKSSALFKRSVDIQTI